MSEAGKMVGEVGAGRAGASGTWLAIKKTSQSPQSPSTCSGAQVVISDNRLIALGNFLQLITDLLRGQAQLVMLL